MLYAMVVQIPWSALLVLLLILVASVAMYVVLVSEETSRRQWVALRQWAREHSFRADRSPGQELGEPLSALGQSSARIRIRLSTESTSLVNLETERTCLAAAATVGAADDVIAAAQGQMPWARWNLLIQQIDLTWPPTGARPAGAAASLLDLFSLSSFPLLGNSDRFVIYGVDSVAARILGNSSIRALLPPDIGLLLHGQYIILDFTTRPFDAIEFDRMQALVDQLIPRLPAPG